MSSRSLVVALLLLPTLALAAPAKSKKKTKSPPAKPTAQIVVPTAKATDLGTIIVSATRSSQPGNTTPATVIVIGRDEIERSGHTHVVDVLRGRAGVEVSDLFGDGSRANVGLRGFGENAPSNTLVLVNGRRLNNPDIASQDFNGVPLDSIERIEIIQGSAGALYGDQAVGGVINLITRTASRSSGYAEINTGSFGRAGGRAGGTYAVNPDLRFGLNANVQRTDNYRAHNRLDLYNVQGRAEYDWKNGGVFLELQHENERLQFAGSLFQAQLDADRRRAQPGRETDFGNTATDLIRLGLRQSLGTNWTLESEFSSRVASGEARLGANLTQHRRVYGFTPRVVGRFAAWDGQTAQLTAGVDVYASTYRLLSPFGEQRNDQEAYDGYAQLVLPLTDKTGFTGALRYGTVSNDLFFTPNAFEIGDQKLAHSEGLYWQVRPELKLTLRYDRSFRFAKVDEYGGTGFVPVPSSLRTQTGNSYEIGAEWRDGGLQALAQIYRLDLKNEIAFEPTTFTNLNIPESTRDGQLLELRYALLETLSAFGSYTHIDARAKGGLLNNRRIPLSAEHQGRVGFEWQPLKTASAFVEAQTFGQRLFGGDYDNSLAPLPAYSVVNLGGSYRHASGFHAKARVNNLLNEKYSETGFSAFNPFPTEVPSFVPAPELNFRVTLGYEFGS